MRIIDADELLKSVRESAKRAEEWLADCKAYKSNMTARAEQAILTFNECALRIKNAPTVDAVEVVRCKDCRHWSGRKYNVHINGFLPWCRFSALQREANDFCSYGERKEDGSHEQRGEKA